MIEATFALFNVDQLVTMAPGSHPAAQGPLGIIERAALAAKGECIVWVGTMQEMHEQVRLTADATVLNTHGRTVLPGFVDPHTHPVFAGERSGDFYARALGERYADQLNAGGIMRTVQATRAKSEDELLDLAYQRADVFLRHGVTTIGAKTGYGLTAEDEAKSLRVLNRLQYLHPLKTVPTFLGAHVVPSDFDGSTDAYVTQLIDEWLPAAQGHAQFVDVWCEDGVFSTEQCRRILTRAREMGFQLTAHANEIGPGDGVRLAASLGAKSVDHAVFLEQQDIDALRDAGTVAVLLPGTTFSLGSDRYAPARKLLDAGVTVALGTDFNPGTSYTQNMPFIVTLAVLKLGMTPEEAFRAATLGGAAALDLQDRVGSLEPDKYCDFVAYCTGDYRDIPYQYAMNLVDTVVARAQVTVQDGQTVTNPRALLRPA